MCVGQQFTACIPDKFCVQMEMSRASHEPVTGKSRIVIYVKHYIHTSFARFLMPGDSPVQSKQPEAPHESSLFSSTFEHIKHGVSSVTSSDIVQKSIAKGHEIINDPTTKKIAGQVADAGRQALHKGQEIAQDPRTQHVAGQVVGAGKDVAREHVNRVNGVIEAGKRHDINGVIQQGLPLAGEALMGPGAAAAMIAKEKGGKILMDNVPAEHRDTVRKIQGATDLATAKTSKILPHLIIDGADSNHKY